MHSILDLSGLLLAFLLFQLQLQPTQTQLGVLGKKSREERALPLIFPPTAPTRTQWIVGIGIPLEDLVFNAMTTGYVLKAEYFLPSTVLQLRTKTQLNLNSPLPPRVEEARKAKFEQHLAGDDELRPNATHAGSKPGKTVLASYRWSVYKGLEGLANRIGLRGRACVLKSICEAAEVPFDYKNGLFGELLHILLTPSSSADELSEYADNEYYQAESIGLSTTSCHDVFRNCPKSLLDHFSDVSTLSEDMLKLLM